MSIRTDDNIVKDDSACDYCGQLIMTNGHKTTTDLMVCATTYLDTEVHKTLEQVPLDEFQQDYIVFALTVRT